MNASLVRGVSRCGAIGKDRVHNHADDVVTIVVIAERTNEISARAD